ncbi:MAG TPA: globin [Candidatus Dormibacteraeota bacterium]|nr:globin [Candidatus Dormibacteraeota bacterium]
MLNRSLYDLVGGEQVFRQLVRRFYDGIASDLLLRPLYPDEDLSGATERLTLFLIQYWGGPATYSAQRGHPRLRMRHQPFAIGIAERDAWLRHMTAAVDSLELAPQARQALLDYFETASTAMINQPAPSPRP